MSIEVDFSGLEKLQRKLRELEGDHNVPLPELMPDSFIRQHTNFQSLQAMLDAGGVKEDEDIDSDEFSEFIADRTRFKGWRDFCEFASSEWVGRQLEL
ncbi:MAG: hypothetical protein ACR2H4_16900 [Pyrinomonadaceae bacterium]